MTNESFSIPHSSTSYGAETHDDPESDMLSTPVTVEEKESGWKISEAWKHINDQSMRVSATLLVIALILGLLAGFILNTIFQ